MARHGRQQFQFTAIEMIALAVSFTATAALVFLLGFYVGKRNAAEHGPVAEMIARVPVQDASRYTRPAVEEEAAKAEPTPPQPAAKPKARATVDRQPAPAERRPPKKEDEVGAAYSVQVLATRRKGDADALARSLVSSGFDAYVRHVQEGQGSWYRVRIGRFPSLGDARAMAERCRRELGMDQAYVSTY